MNTLTVRPATEADARTLSVLAALDSAAPLTGEVLVARVDDRPVAAISLADGRAVADPFVASAAAVEVLRVRVQQVAGPARRPRWARLWVPARLAAG